ncbi:peptidylprolyl isomerase [Blastopirellula sp. J2-11]|uniref:peptidylprolyl isomerase n=1 Tax=Blastopirellula sp. J2-11 TaxID=2943192 RepID=UPI0021C9BA73|nr:peptidylprolyl isomerase [Blastopirellula sp. J2-11]UUO08802.1 peptidylprolyl isomerase [Blastopirellula sp. J2-11]
MLPPEIVILIFACFVAVSTMAMIYARHARVRIQPVPGKGGTRRNHQQSRIETLEVREVFDAAGVELEGEDLFLNGTIYQNVDMVALAKAITASGAKFYGAVWCPHCTAQKGFFGEGGSYLPFYEVTNSDHTLNALGSSLGIQALPTWIFANGTRVEGTLTIEQLVQLTGVTVPTSTTPYIAEIAPITLYAGEPLFLTLDGYSPTGEALTYTVTSSSGTVLTEVRQQTRSLRITVKNFGVMEFQLLEDYANLATDQIIALAQAGIYDGLKFHRVKDNFVIQGGDPLGTGAGDPTIPYFDDQYDFDLRYNRSGVLGMAKSYDDTNSSQFFITEGSQRESLDFKYTIFGYLTEGDAVREAISEVPTNSGDYPTSDVIIEKVEVFQDHENALVKLNTFIAGITGNDTLTITATDASGRTFSRQVNVAYFPTSANKVAYLGDIPDLIVHPGSVLTYQLIGYDANGDTVRFLDKAGLSSVPVSIQTTNANGLIYSVDNSTGVLTIQAPSSFRGQGQVIVAAYDFLSTSSLNYDFQVINISASAAPILVNDTFDTIAGSVNSITPLANDNASAPAFDLNTLEILSVPDGIQLGVQDGVITYTAPVGYSGSFTVDYKISNIYGAAGNFASLTINVSPNTLAVAGDDAYQIDVDSIAIFDVLNNDRLNKFLTSNMGMSITSVGVSSVGAAIAIQDGKIRYIPAAGYSGLDTFTYTVTNGTSVVTGTVSVSIVDIQDFGVTVSREKTEDLAPPPISDPYLNEWDSFWVEVWVNSDRISTQGISTAALGMHFVPGLFDATTIEPGAGFQFNSTPTINGETGEITGLEAVATTAGLGSGQRVLLARIRFQPSADGGLSVDSDGIPFDAFFSVRDAQIQAADTEMLDAQVTALPTTKILPVIYDLNDDGKIDLSDVFVFRDNYLGNTSAVASIGDFDLNGAVNTYDLSLLIREIGETRSNVSDAAPGHFIAYDFNYLSNALSQTPLSVGISPPADDVTSLTPEVVQPVLDAAAAKIADAYSQLGVFNFVITTNFQIVDLPGSQLSYRNNGILYLDIDAAGYGWFVDSTPAQNEEFSSSGVNSWNALAESDADGKIDLLTVILHELISHQDETEDDLFTDYLYTSKRFLFAPEDLPIFQLLNPALVDQALADEDA